MARDYRLFVLQLFVALAPGCVLLGVRASQAAGDYVSKVSARFELKRHRAAQAASSFVGDVSRTRFVLTRQALYRPLAFPRTATRSLQLYVRRAEAEVRRVDRTAQRLHRRVAVARARVAQLARPFRSTSPRYAAYSGW